MPRPSPLAPHPSLLVSAALPPYQTLPPSYEGTRYAYVVPILPGGWVLLGELMHKYVALSTLRFEQVSASETTLDVSVVGAPNEQVSVCVTRRGSSAAEGPRAELAVEAEEEEGLRVVCKEVIFGAAGGWQLLRFGA